MEQELNRKRGRGEGEKRKEGSGETPEENIDVEGDNEEGESGSEEENNPKKRKFSRYGQPPRKFQKVMEDFVTEEEAYHLQQIQSLREEIKSLMDEVKRLREAGQTNAPHIRQQINDNNEAIRFLQAELQNMREQYEKEKARNSENLKTYGNIGESIKTLVTQVSNAYATFYAGYTVDPMALDKIINALTPDAFYYLSMMGPVNYSETTEQDFNEYVKFMTDKANSLLQRDYIDPLSSRITQIDEMIEELSGSSDELTTAVLNMLNLVRDRMEINRSTYVEIIKKNQFKNSFESNKRPWKTMRVVYEAVMQNQNPEEAMILSGTFPKNIYNAINSTIGMMILRGLFDPLRDTFNSIQNRTAFSQMLGVDVGAGPINAFISNLPPTPELFARLSNYATAVGIQGYDPYAISCNTIEFATKMLGEWPRKCIEGSKDAIFSYFNIIYPPWLYWGAEQ